MEVKFNSFYELFQKKFDQMYFEQFFHRIGDNEDELVLEGIVRPYFGSCMAKEERLSIFDQLLKEVCLDYLNLTESDFEVIPVDCFEFVNHLLDEMEKDDRNKKYQESFLLSLQFIYKDYFFHLNGSKVSLESSSSNQDSSYLQVILNQNAQITDFSAINMDLIEQDKVMTKLLSMERKQQLGPIPKVKILTRQDFIGLSTKK